MCVLEYRTEFYLSVYKPFDGREVDSAVSSGARKESQRPLEQVNISWILAYLDCFLPVSQCELNIMKDEGGSFSRQYWLHG